MEFNPLLLSFCGTIVPGEQPKLLSNRRFAT
jgi:hypothetical protein